MPWLRFTAEFHWCPREYRGRWSRSYREGTTHFVTSRCAAQAIAKGKATVVLSEAERRAARDLLALATVFDREDARR